MCARGHRDRGNTRVTRKYKNAHAHARTHARTHARAHTHTQVTRGGTDILVRRQRGRDLYLDLSTDLYLYPQMHIHYIYLYLQIYMHTHKHTRVSRGGTDILSLLVLFAESGHNFKRAPRGGGHCCIGRGLSVRQPRLCAHACCTRFIHMVMYISLMVIYTILIHTTLMQL